MTTAFLVLRMAIGDFRYREVPFDEIMDEVQSGAVDAGLLIHEGQLTYEAEGLTKVLDLGEWWLLETGLPLPLGANVARRDLGEETLARALGRCSPPRSAPGSSNRSEAMAYAMEFSRGLEPHLADRFVGMYVNELTRGLRRRGSAGGRGAPAPRRGARRLPGAGSGRIRLSRLAA